VSATSEDELRTALGVGPDLGLLPWVVFHCIPGMRGSSADQVFFCRPCSDPVRFGYYQRMWEGFDGNRQLGSDSSRLSMSRLRNRGAQWELGEKHLLRVDSVGRVTGKFGSRSVRQFARSEDHSNS
jgi:hypothetical protein